ncbi:MAG: DUF4339 domain-containing protein [Planctomycetota bacterium]|nr:DUF4339 domain-containing protein [Planctomycetota bacterium]
MDEYYFSVDGRATGGPVPMHVLAEMARVAAIGPRTQVWRAGETSRTLARAIPELAQLFLPSDDDPADAGPPVPSAPPPLPQEPAFPPPLETPPRLSAPQPPPLSAPPPLPPPVNSPPPLGVPPAPPTIPGPLIVPQRQYADGMGITSMVLGIVAIAIVFCVNIFAAPLPITGLILGLLSKQKGGVRTTGIILNSIALALLAGLVVAFIMSA